MDVMNIEDEILARIRAAKAWDKGAMLGNFQIRAAENGYVLINLKTGRAQLIYDEMSELHDLEQLFPGLVFVEFAGNNRRRAPGLCETVARRRRFSSRH